MPSGSLDRLPSNVQLSAEQTAENAATGGRFGGEAGLTWTVAVAVAPRLSVTVSVPV